MTGSPPPGSDRELEVLQGVSHSFGSTLDLTEILEETCRWIRAGVGSEAVGIRILLPDAGGRLRSVLVDGEVGEGGRKRSARRRLAFQNRRVARLSSEGDPDRSIVILPLVVRGESLGVLELLGPRSLVDERWGTIEAVASQAAIVLKHRRVRSLLHQEGETLRATVALGREMVRRRSPQRAVEAAVRFIFERSQVPVAAWMLGDEQGKLTLLQVRGGTTAQRRELRSAMGAVPPWETLGPTERSRLQENFARVVGVKDVGVIVAGDVLLLLGRESGVLPPPIAVVGSLLVDVLRNVHAVAHAERRNQELDLGIAWTAHEFRGPLLGVKAILEFLSSDSDAPPAQKAMLGRSLQELERLAELVDAVLRWAVGASPLRPRAVDANRVVEEAAETCRLENGDHRVSVRPARSTLVWVDVPHARGAIANVIRNALIYSPPSSAVQVVVEPRQGAVRISVMDEGPGIAPSDRERIFDPFVRGHKNGSRQGSGLGLFIARRVVEAHGGTIRVGTSAEGAVFHIELPTRAEAS